MQSKTSPCVELGLAAIALPGQPQCFFSGLGSCPLLLVRAVNFIAYQFLGLDPVPHTYLYDHHGHPVLHSPLLPSPRQEHANEHPRQGWVCQLSELCSMGPANPGFPIPDSSQL